MNRIVFVAALVCAGLAGGLLRDLYRPRPASPATEKVPAAAPTPPAPATASSATAPATAPPRPTVDVREKVQERIAANAGKQRDEAELDAYLNELETQARRNGRVTALEVEPGLDAIRRLTVKLGPALAARKQHEFGDRMATLSQKLDGRQPVVAPDLEALKTRIATAASDEERQPLMRQFRVALGSLDPTERADEEQFLLHYAKTSQDPRRPQ
jgi:hypothetical protein